MYLVLLRHTKVNIPSGICYGQFDVPLLDEPLEEFKKIKNFLSQFEPYTLITSPSSRCKKLASFLRNENFVENSSLLEMNFGNWEGKFWNEIPKEEIELWYNDFVNYKIPNGESFSELHSRVINFLKEISSTQNQVWITHAGVIRSVICEILNLDLENAFLFEIDFGTAVILQRRHGNWILKLGFPIF